MKCRKFLILDAYKVIYEELEEALKIFDVSRVMILSQEMQDDMRSDIMRPCFKSFDEDNVFSDLRKFLISGC